MKALGSAINGPMLNVSIRNTLTDFILICSYAQGIV